MRNYLTLVCSGAALLATISLTGGAVRADNPRSHDGRHKFSDVFLALKPGDEVTFANRDGVIHKVMSVSPEYRLEVGELQPGADKSLVFNRKGVVDLSCSMHPEMKMTVFVRNPPKQPDAEVIDNGVIHTTINLLSAS